MPEAANRPSALAASRICGSLAKRKRSSPSSTASNARTRRGTNCLFLFTTVRRARRKGDEENAALSDSGFALDQATHRPNTVGRYRQTEAKAAHPELIVHVHVSPEESIEDRGSIGFRDSKSVVTDSDHAHPFGRAFPRCRRDLDVALRLLRIAVLDRVGHEIYQGQFEARRIS